MPIFRNQPQQVDSTHESDSADVQARTETDNAGAAARAQSARAVQAEGSLAGHSTDEVHDIAAGGVSGGGGALPFADTIARSFGEHDISGVRAHTGDSATKANAELGSTAYATGNDIAFGGAPDLHTAAHEAAHVVQQRSGVHLKGGIGQEGDKYEQHADAVADLVVGGQSAEAMLSTVTSEGSGSGEAVQPKVSHFVQFIGTPLDERLPEGAEAPEHGETRGQQRRYSVEQYQQMWEQEQGRKLTRSEKRTIARGCIGLTALNLTGGGNPPLDNAFSTFDAAHAAMTEKNKELDELRADPETADSVDGQQAVLFAKLFWSNQDPDQEKRKKPDDDAFLPDDTGRVDMSGYEYRAQPGFVNFDYGFWDDTSRSFWHANHSQPGMKVYQSTKEKFSAGYTDFDRIIFCVGIAENYDPGLAAISHG